MAASHSIITKMEKPITTISQTAQLPKSERRRLKRKPEEPVAAGAPAGQNAVVNTPRRHLLMESSKPFIGIETCGLVTRAERARSLSLPMAMKKHAPSTGLQAGCMAKSSIRLRQCGGRQT